MENKAINYFNQEYNCSQCILKAFGDKYHKNIDEQSLAMCSVFSNGLGIGGFCGVIAAGIMICGLLSDELPAKKMRICFLTEFRERYPYFNCGLLKKKICSEEGCQEIVGFTAALIDKIIEREKTIYGHESLMP